MIEQITFLGSVVRVKLQLGTQHLLADLFNNPSLVLYIHRPDQPDHAVSYSWADPKADRIGINLRWVQANCIREVANP